MRLTGWRYAAFIGSFVSAISVCSYFIIISPMLNPEPYKQMREQAEAQMAKRK